MSSMTVAEFCHAERISRSKFFMMVRLEQAPILMRFPNSNMIRIEQADYLARKQKQRAWQESPQAKLEQERRAARARELGKLATESNRHVSKKRAASLCAPAAAELYSQRCRRCGGLRPTNRAFPASLGSDRRSAQEQTYEIVVPLIS